LSVFSIFSRPLGVLEDVVVEMPAQIFILLDEADHEFSVYVLRRSVGSAFTLCRDD